MVPDPVLSTFMSKQLNETSTRITRAVKAELARRDQDGLALVDVLGMNRNAVYARLRYEVPFTTDELDKIATFFGMTFTSLIASANLDRQRQAVA